MTCLEAQSKIIAYIDYNLEKDEKKEFLTHIQTCSNCREELDIYYTMLEGMRQLDGNLPLSKDFTAELNSRIEKELRTDRNKKSILSSTILIVVTAFLGFSIFAYVNFLDLVYENEQAALKAAQGDYYYTETFDRFMFQPEDEQRVLNINVEEKPEQSFYEKIRQYNMLKQ